MPFFVEQVVEQVIESNDQNSDVTTTDPLFSVLVISIILLYFFRNIVFSLLKFGFIGFLAFTLYKFIT